MTHPLPNKVYNVSLHARTGNQTQGTIEVHLYTEQERLRRALKFGGMSWGFSIASIVLPGVHFVLVPFFFFAGPVVAILFYRPLALLEKGSGPCPFCKANVDIGRGSIKVWPDPQWSLEELCTKCQNNCTIHLSS
jgi:hypothetical protein